MTREEIIAISNGYISGEDRNKLKEFFSDLNNVRTNRRTIVFSTPSETGTSFFRILEPLLAIYRATDDFNLIYTEKITPFMIEVADLIVVHRAGSEHDQIHTLMKHLPREKVPPVIVHNVDDNEFNLPPSHPMKDMWIAMGKDKMAIRSISESDHVETTTKKLASTFKGYNRSVHIRRNRFNWNLPQWNMDDTKKKEMFGDKIVVGWCGLTSHFNDLIKMKPILKRIQEEFPNVHILLAGMAISDKKYEVKQDPNTGQKYVEESDIENKEETYRARVAQLYSDLDQSRLTMEDAVGLEEYGKFYSLIDIGIAYIEHNGFNACKSEIKNCEYAIYGSIPVYSNFGGYYDFHEIMKQQKVLSGLENEDQYYNNMAVNTERENEWFEKLRYWIDMRINRPEEYNTIADKVKNFVKHYYSIDEHIHEQIEFYSRLIEENLERSHERITRHYKKYEEMEAE